jgi:hypothetical protein
MGKVIAWLLTAALAVSALVLAATGAVHIGPRPHGAPRVACCSHAAAIVSSAGVYSRKHGIVGSHATIIATGEFCVTLESTITASSSTPEVTGDDPSGVTGTVLADLQSEPSASCPANSIEVLTYLVSEGVAVPTDEGFSVVVP